MLTPEIKKSLDTSVLVWLATASTSGLPNVSPKEIFTHFDNETVIIANIASPNSVKNIRTNPLVCLSFIDILVQKGYQLKGTAEIIDQQKEAFSMMSPPLLQLTKGQFPFASITAITITSVKPILAPRYLLYPETTEADQIASARKAYGLE